VEFCGGGEPTLHPDFTEALDRFVENRIAFGLLTNGTRLTPEVSRRLVDHGFYCRVSVEAGGPEVFQRYKRPKSKDVGFEAVIDGIRNLVTLRDAALPDTRLQISYKYAIDTNNHTDVFQAVEIAHQLGVDSIQFKCIRNVPSEIEDGAIIEQLKAGFSEYKARYLDLRILDNIDKSRLRTGRCWLSPFQLTVDPFGDVFICCYYRHRRSQHRLGNLLERSLKDIWYSEEHWEKIDRIEVKDCNKYDCRFHHYNDLMHELVIEDTGQLCFI
jgi:radical SAM protein with 4Fe4S-binding SPASM domain